MSTCICGNPKPTRRLFFCTDCFCALPPLMREELRLSFTTSPRGGVLYERALAWLGERRREDKEKRRRGDREKRRQGEEEAKAKAKPASAAVRVSEF